MSSFLRHLGTIQRPLVFGQSKKVDVESTGTPDTLPDTPDSEFYENDRTNNRDINDNDEVLSPIGHTSVNLGMEYDAEADNYSPASPVSDGVPARVSALSPIEETSSKRDVFNALRAIAKSPNKHERSFSSKKEFMSALRGFAVSPTKEEEELADSSDKNPEPEEVEAVHPFDASADFNNNFNSPNQTPTKETPVKDCPTGEESEIITPEKSNDVNNSYFSPETKELFDLNNTMNNLQNNVLALIKNDPGSAVKSKSGGKVINDYRAAVEDYRAAIMEFESEMSHATHQSADSVEKVESILQQLEKPLSAIKGPMETICSYDVQKFAGAQKRLIDDTGIMGGENDDLIEALEPQSDLDNTFVTAGEYSVKEETIASYIRPEFGTQSLPEEPTLGPVSLGSPTDTQEQEKRAASLILTLEERPTVSKNPTVAPTLKSTSDVQREGTVTKEKSPIACASRPIIDSQMQRKGASSLIMLFEKKAPPNTNTVMKKRDIVSHVKDRFKANTIDKKISVDTDISPPTDTVSVVSPCESTYTNTGQKAPTVVWENRQRFSSFKETLPDISPDKTETTASANNLAPSSSSTESTFSARIRNIKENMHEKQAKLCKALENALSESPTNQDVVNGDIVPIQVSKPGQEREIENPASPNLLDKAVNLNNRFNDAGDKSRVPVSLTPLQAPIEPNSYSNLTDKMKPHTSPMTRDGPDSRTLELLDKYSSPVGQTVQEIHQAKGLPPRPPRRNTPPHVQTVEAARQSGLLEDVLKLNLGPTLTKEILQSLNQASSAAIGSPNIGIQHIYTTNNDRDDCSEVSSLGNASILSSAALSTLSAMARKNPSAPIENILREFKRVQTSQVQTDAEVIDYDSSDDREIGKVEVDSSVGKSPHRSAFGLPFHTTNIPDSPVRPSPRKVNTQLDVPDIPIRLNPPKVDSQPGRRVRAVQRKLDNRKEFPALAPGVLNDFEKLQEHLKMAKEEDRVLYRLNKKVDSSRDNMQNEKLMNQFESIEQMKMNSQASRFPKPGHKIKDLSKLGITNPIRSTSRPSQNLDVSTSNDWFIDASIKAGGTTNNEQFCSLLETGRSKDEVDQIERKKQIYEARHEQQNEKENEDPDVSVSLSTTTGRKKRNVLKKIFRRKKKSNKDDEGSMSSYGISSIASMSTCTVEGVKKKKRFKFLPSLRRKNRRGDDQSNSVARCNNSRVFEEEKNGDEQDDISGNFIISTMEMMEDIEDLDDDALDESSVSESDRHSLTSGASGSLNKNDCAYVTLS